MTSKPHSRDLFEELRGYLSAPPVDGDADHKGLEVLRRIEEQLEAKQRELDEEIERAVENGRLAKRLHEQLEAAGTRETALLNLIAEYEKRLGYPSFMLTPVSNPAKRPT